MASKDFMGKDGFAWFVGVVEDRNDPLELGRVRVRCLGHHTADLTQLPTADLPWAHVMHPVTDPAMHGMGMSPSFLVEGTWVIGFFRDFGEKQQPVIMGSLPGVPQKPADYRAGFNDPRNKNSTQVNESNIPPYAGGDNNPADDRTPEPPDLGLQSGVIGDGPAITDDEIAAVAKSVGISEDLLRDVLYRESRLSHTDKDGNVLVGDKHLADGHLGDPTADGVSKQAYGAMQIRATAVEDVNRVYGTNYTVEDLQDKEKNLLIGASYLKLSQDKYQHLYAPGFDPDDYAYVAYRWGPNPPDSAIISESAARFTKGGSGKVPGLSSSYTQRSYGPYPINKKYSSDVPRAPDYDEYDQPYARNSGHRIGEPDTSRLGRGVTSETHGHLVRRRNMRRTSIPTATKPFVNTVEFNAVQDTASTWDEPHPKGLRKDASPYTSAQYPLNHVYESESGHIMEIDDTPDGERLYREHMSGTFEEIHSDGTKVVKVVGDNYEIIAKDSNVLISGSVNLTVGGTVRQLIKGDYILEVEGNMTTKVHKNQRTKIGAGDGGGNREEEIRGNLALNVKDDLKFLFGNDQYESGNIDTTIHGNVETKINGKLDTVVKEKVSLLTLTDIQLVALSNFHAVASSGIMSVKTGDKLNLKSGATMHIKSETTIDMDATTEVDIDSALINLN